jgi:hypothetical protein
MHYGEMLASYQRSHEAPPTVIDDEGLLAVEAGEPARLSR